MSILSFLAHAEKNTWAYSGLTRFVLMFPVLIRILGEVGGVVTRGRSEYKYQSWSGASSNK